MIRDAALVLILQTSDIGWIENSTAAQTLAGKQIMRERTQFILQPFRERNTETFLASTPNKRRHQSFRGLLQNIFRSVTMQLVPRRQRRREFGHARIEIGG